MWKVLFVKKRIESNFSKHTFLTFVGKAYLLCDKSIFVSKGSSADISIHIPLGKYLTPSKFSRFGRGRGFWWSFCIK
jgi:hypothetical protein